MLKGIDEEKCKTVNKPFASEKIKIEQSREELAKYKSSIVYNIDLYSCKFSNMPVYINDEDFNKFFKTNYNIFVTWLDSKHVKEIRTGIVFPIVDLDNGYFSKDTSKIKYNINSDENCDLFAISYNEIVLKDKKFDLNKLINYFNEDMTDIQHLIKYQQMSGCTAKTSKMLKK